MDNYLILITVPHSNNFNEYHYLFEKYDIILVGECPNNNVDEIVKELFKKVRPYSDWQLFIVDQLGEIDILNFYNEIHEKILGKILSKDVLRNGNDKCKPPERIYVINEREEYLSGGEETEVVSIIKDVLPCCRFLVFYRSKKPYMKLYEDLKIVSTIIVFANNNMPPEVMEAYYVYKIDLEFREGMLHRFFENEEWEIEKRREELRQQQEALEETKGNKSYGYHEYSPHLSVSTFRCLKIHRFSYGKEKEADEVRWKEENKEIEVRIAKVKEEQLENQRELKKEMTGRMEKISQKEIYLSTEGERNFNDRIKVIQKELNDCYVDYWEMDEELENQRVSKAEEIDELLSQRYTLKEILAFVLEIFILIVGVFIVFSMAELGIKTKFEPVVWRETLEEFLPYLLEVSGGMFVFIVLFLVKWLWGTFLDIQSEMKEYNAILNKINSRIRYNLTKYRQFFSKLYHIKICQNYLINQGIIKHEKAEKLEKIKEEKKECDESSETLKKLKEKVENIISVPEEDRSEEIDVREGLIDINEGSIKIYSPLGYVDKIVIRKEVCDGKFSGDTAK